jgi:hypothetical protein
MNDRQITVLTGNSAAHLLRVFSLLSREGVDVRAHCLVDNGSGNCKLRMIVSQPDKAVGILTRHQLTAVVNPVVIIEADDRPGGLSRMLGIFEHEDVQIEYTYTAASEKPGVAVMVFRFSDTAAAVKIIEKNGIRMQTAPA